MAHGHIARSSHAEFYERSHVVSASGLTKGVATTIFCADKRWRGDEMQLSEFVDILPGVPFRTRIESEKGGACIVVQARDLVGDGKVDLEGAARIAAPPSSTRGFLKPGDVVFQPRGNRYSVGKVDEVQGPAVVAAPLYILRSRAKDVDPDFLVALLEASSTQAALRLDAVGTYVPQIPRQALETLRVELPDLPSQIRLADIARLERRETELTDRLREARNRLFDMALREIAKKSRKRANAPGSNRGFKRAPTP